MRIFVAQLNEMTALLKKPVFWTNVTLINCTNTAVEFTNDADRPAVLKTLRAVCKSNFEELWP